MRAALLALAVLIVAAPVAAARDRAPGAPGARATFGAADKHGFGTAHDLRSKVWFTLRAAELSEVYYPGLGTPAIRDLEFVVSDGRTFAERETRATARVERPDPRSLTFRQVVETPRWRLTKTYVSDPARATVLMDVDLESRTGGPLRLYALLDPALTNGGDDDRGTTRRGALVAWDRRSASALMAAPGLRESSSGYARRGSDPLRDVRRDGDLDRRLAALERGNVRQAARTALDGVQRRRMTLALGFGRTPAAALATARGSLDGGFGPAAAAYAAGWAGYLDSLPGAPRSVADPALRAAYDTSLMVLDASEDKTFRGAGIASPSMPWAWGKMTIEKDLPSGPYHLVWSRDLYQVGTALLAAGDAAAAHRAVSYLFFRQQKADGSFPQNSVTNGRQRWEKTQMDEVALPIVLAWQLGRDDRPTWRRIRRAADYVVRTGPRSQQERWENQAGWSPATIAAEIAGLVCAADIARRRGAFAAAARYERTADVWARDVERWTATTTGPWSPRPYYLRVTKKRDPDRATRYNVGDSGTSDADQRREVDPSFLELVRLGVKRHDDPVVLNTLQVVDAKLRVDTPHGPFWHRFTTDGYGEERDGGMWDINEPDTFRTLGRVWPIFSGERGEYELMAGRPAGAYLRSMALAGNDGGMIPEQVWDGRAPTGRPGFAAGEGTFSATPLAWSHAQFIRLAHSIDAGRPVEQPAVVACRYTGRCG